MIKIKDKSSDVQAKTANKNLNLSNHKKKISTITLAIIQLKHKNWFYRGAKYSLNYNSCDLKSTISAIMVRKFDKIIGIRQIIRRIMEQIMEKTKGAILEGDFC